LEPFPETYTYYHKNMQRVNRVVQAMRKHFNTQDGLSAQRRPRDALPVITEGCCTADDLIARDVCREDEREIAIESAARQNELLGYKADLAINDALHQAARAAAAFGQPAKANNYDHALWQWRGTTSPVTGQDVTLIRVAVSGFEPFGTINFYEVQKYGNDDVLGKQPDADTERQETLRIQQNGTHSPIVRFSSVPAEDELTEMCKSLFAVTRAGIVATYLLDGRFADEVHLDATLQDIRDQAFGDEASIDRLCGHIRRRAIQAREIALLNEQFGAGPTAEKLDEFWHDLTIT